MGHRTPLEQEGLILWNQFKDKWTSNIKMSDRDKILRFRDYSDRKYLIKDLLPAIADDMGLLFNRKEEFLKIDYTLYKVSRKHGWAVPKIFIESENIKETADKEARKLGSVIAPLKILIHYGLSDEFRKEIYEHQTHWDYIFRDYLEESILAGIFVLMVLDKEEDNSMTFHYVIYGEDALMKESGDLVTEF